MKTDLKTGIKGKFEKIIEQSDTAFDHGSVFNGVLGTPALLAFFEAAAQQSVLPHLPEGFVTLGTEFNISHLKPLTVGNRIICRSILYKTEKNNLHFKVEAHSDKKLIAKGEIVQFAVKGDRLTKLLPHL